MAKIKSQYRIGKNILTICSVLHDDFPKMAPKPYNETLIFRKYWVVDIENQVIVTNHIELSVSKNQTSTHIEPQCSNIISNQH